MTKQFYVHLRGSSKKKVIESNPKNEFFRSIPQGHDGEIDQENKIIESNPKNEFFRSIPWFASGMQSSCL